MTDEQLFSLTMQATADRPLAGLTVLLVEDSRLASEAMRLLCLRSGARIRRADSLRAARRHLAFYRPTAVIVDLGLPDGDGADLIADLARAHPRVDVILGLSGDPGQEGPALAAGADGFLGKPILSLDLFQHAILQCLPRAAAPRGPRALGGEMVHPDVAAFHDDLAHAAELLTARSDTGGLAYATEFLKRLAVQAEDPPLRRAADDLSRARDGGQPYGADLARLAGLVQSRLQERRVV